MPFDCHELFDVVYHAYCRETKWHLYKEVIDGACACVRVCVCVGVCVGGGQG